MVHGGHLDLSAFEATKAALDDHKAFVAAGGIFQADGVIVGFKHPFAVILGRFTDGGPVDADLVGLGDAQITSNEAMPQTIKACLV